MIRLKLLLKGSFLPIVLCAAALTGCADQETQPEHFSANIAITWNARIIELAVETDGLLTLNGVRTEAMAFAAAHNALNAIVPVYESYDYSGTAPDANPTAAVAQALFEVTVVNFPDHRQEIQGWLYEALDTIPKGDARESGIQLGKETSQALLDKRRADGWDGEAEYTWHPMAPGVYAEFNEHSGTPEGFVFGAGWAKARPFLLESPDQFRAPPPPEISSDAYTEAYNEVKSVGSAASTNRTDDQTHLAMWWKDFVENSHNRLARKLVVREGLNLWQTVRCMALLNMTIYDAYVNIFDNKFHYNHWRPYTAIRWAANDENPDTEPDPEWNNLHRHTYAFPSYPSAHGSASSAAMRVLSATLGTGDTYSFTMETTEVDSAGPFSGKMRMDPPVRSFDSFTEAGLEAAMSRVYLGIHFRYDSEEGHRLGNRIGDYAVQNFLAPLPR
ncbi:vanadium-dependent haloperoxidase [Robiginitalea sp. SC105]|uniref:vanadium-dependent haloperoxidase n=1 Tax=Robiginitalea sp. SC105 TaxID=2762332 RepID=UPI00163AC792|nr:vanadium-dependent haloperoxidase [Robiginitalea sp. SC105]MBC2838307.1 vanadium-dependent haloperoxidase [Robiginitalea sp. SC105]